MNNCSFRTNGALSNSGTITLNSDSSNFGSILLSDTYSESNFKKSDLIISDTVDTLQVQIIGI